MYSFGEGADVWVLPAPEESRAARMVDMKLDFPFANWQARSSPQKSESLLTWTDPSFEVQCQPHAPLITPARSVWPTEWVVFLPTQNRKTQPMAWLNESQKILRQLDKQSFRLWIPAMWKEELLKSGLLPVGSYCEYHE